jgi:hypothetical protein
MVPMRAGRRTEFRNVVTHGNVRAQPGLQQGGHTPTLERDPASNVAPNLESKACLEPASETPRLGGVSRASGELAAPRGS